jgi:hypothetical protein
MLFSQPPNSVNLLKCTIASQKTSSNQRLVAELSRVAAGAGITQAECTTLSNAYTAMASVISTLHALLGTASGHLATLNAAIYALALLPSIAANGVANVDLAPGNYRLTIGGANPSVAISAGLVRIPGE